MVEISGERINQELYEKGIAVFCVDAESSVIEKWCTKISGITGLLVD
jgi:hypothetical protein